MYCFPSTRAKRLGNLDGLTDANEPPIKKLKKEQHPVHLSETRPLREDSFDKPPANYRKRKSVEKPTQFSTEETTRSSKKTKLSVEIDQAPATEIEPSIDSSASFSNPASADELEPASTIERVFDPVTSFAELTIEIDRAVPETETQPAIAWAVSVYEPSPESVSNLRRRRPEIERVCDYLRRRELAPDREQPILTRQLPQFIPLMIEQICCYIRQRELALDRY